MNVFKFMAMFAAAVAVGSSFAGVDSYLYYMLDNALTYSELAGPSLAGKTVPVEAEETYAKVSTDGGETYLTLYTADGATTSQEVTLGQKGYVGFSSTSSFTSFLFEVYDGYDKKLGWTTLAYDKESEFIYKDPSESGGTSVFHITSLIPEPTSGLLLLLGAAGLALKRRRMARA